MLAKSRRGTGQARHDQLVTLSAAAQAGAVGAPDGAPAPAAQQRHAAPEPAQRARVAQARQAVRRAAAQADPDLHRGGHHRGHRQGAVPSAWAPGKVPCQHVHGTSWLHWSCARRGWCCVPGLLLHCRAARHTGAQPGRQAARQTCMHMRMWACLPSQRCSGGTDAAPRRPSASCSRCGPPLRASTSATATSTTRASSSTRPPRWVRFDCLWVQLRVAVHPFWTCQRLPGHWNCSPAEHGLPALQLLCVLTHESCFKHWPSML